MAVDLNYGIGVEGKNLVLKTLGRVYVKVKDRKYELIFRPEDLQKMVEGYAGENSGSTGSSSVMFIDSSLDIDNLEYPGDNALVISKDGHIYFTENNEYTEIPIKFSEDELTLENLNISGQIIFTGNNIPLVIPNSNLIQNLNADLLDGYQATDFAIKSQNQNISGSWTYNGQQTFNTAVGQQRLQDSTGQRIYIDFTTGAIRCNTLSANQITVPEQTSEFSIVTGIGKEVWVGSQVGINKSTYIENPDEDVEFNNFYIVETAYNNEEIPNYLTEDGEELGVKWWYDLLFETYNVDEGTYTLRDFNNPTVWETQNAKFVGSQYTLNDFQNLIDGLDTPDSSQFTGDYYSATIPDNVNILALVPNMIVKDNVGNIAYVVNRDGSSLTIRTLDSNNNLNGDQLIVIGTLCHDGGIQFNGDNPSISILKNVLDESSYSIYFGQLSKIDNTKSGIGMILKGSQATNIITDPTLNNIKNYQNTTEINIENPFISWNNKQTVFNQDGSGYLSNGIIRWGDNKLYLDGADIINSRISNTGITNSSFQSGSVLINTDGSGNIGSNITFNTTGVTLNSPLGPAGGDLEGNYPNPTLAQTYKDRISALETQVSDLENKVTDLETQTSNLQYQLQLANNNISTLQRQNTEFEARIEALEARP